MLLATRRQFLRSASASVSAMILGIPLLDQAARAKGVREEAALEIKSDKDFREMFEKKRRKENKPGLVVVIPKDRAIAEQLRYGLTAVFQSNDLHLFTQAAFVCLPAEQAKAFSTELSKDVCLIPIDVHGKPGKPVTLAVASVAQDFVPTCRDLLFGKKNENLDEVIKVQEKAIGKEKAAAMEKAIADLDADEFDRREKAGATIREMLPVAPAIVYRARIQAKSVEEKKRLDDAIGILAKCPEDKKDDTLIPFGVAWVDVDFPCEKCSRSSANPNVRRFLQFVVGK